MDLIDSLRVLATRIQTTKNLVQTEEATKNSMIMPLIQILGYNVFDPLEVTPELVADVGTKKGEKVDYAILNDGKPTILFECKKSGADLNINHAAQLFRYFHVTEARFGVLTNGLRYQFFTDLDEKNKMDEKPFFEFDITNLKDSAVNEIAKFHKSNFDVNKILDNASSLKFIKEIRKQIDVEIQNPSNEFVRLFASKIYNGRLTEKVMDEFTELVQKAFGQLIGEKINERLHFALNKEVIIQEKDQIEEIEQSKVVTSDEELEAYRIVVAILRRKLTTNRIVYRDTQSYFGILLDDNNRKPLCRLHLNGGKKYIGLFNNDKNETRQPIETIDDIYLFENELLETVGLYEVE